MQYRNEDHFEIELNERDETGK